MFPSGERIDLGTLTREQVFELADTIELGKHPKEWPPRSPRPSNRKINRPWTAESLYLMPNNGNHGTRNLGLMASNRDLWVSAPTGGYQALINGAIVGMVELTDERALQQLTNTLSPRTMQTMVAITRLLWEKSSHKPLNFVATCTLGEIARAMGYKAGRGRKIDPEIRLGISHDIRALTQIKSYGADGAYDKRTRRWPSGWLAPLLSMSAVHVQTDLLGENVPYEFDLMLGRNWAETLEHYDVIQVAPGFLELKEDAPIKLGWFYTTAFRDRMTKSKSTVRRSITTLCDEARIDPGSVKHRGRFLDRLDNWHDQLQRQGVIGSYDRRPGGDTSAAPSEVFTRGEYAVTPPAAIRKAYDEPRQKAERRRARS